MSQGQTWLLTGGAGYIGSHIADEFIKADKSVVIYDSDSSDTDTVSSDSDSSNSDFGHRGDARRRNKLPRGKTLDLRRSQIPQAGGAHRKTV